MKNQTLLSAALILLGRGQRDAGYGRPGALCSPSKKELMPEIHRSGAAAAFANGLLNLAMLFVAIILVGPSALVDREVFISMARTNPWPLLLQDVIKFGSSIALLILVLDLGKRLKDTNPTAVRTGTAFGLLSITLLIANGSLSLYATSQAAGLEANAGVQLNLVIGVLGMASVVAGGLWYLLVNWVARKSGSLPSNLSILGSVAGAIALVPPIAILFLLLSIVWSIWLGVVLLKRGQSV